MVIWLVETSTTSNTSVSGQNLIFQYDSRCFFLVTKIKQSHFLCVRFGSNFEIIPHDIRWFDPVLVSLNLVGYSKSYRCVKVFKNLRSLGKVLQTLVCSSRMNFRIDCMSDALLNDNIDRTRVT